ncbi:MAG: class I SAM-dependent methyltransferase [Balneolaceae bacterium]
MKKCNCVLCGSTETNRFHRDDTRMDYMRDYYHCENCKLIFVPPEQRLSAEEEVSRYDMHENNPDDPNYRKFLSRMFNPMMERIPPESYGLDFGSGPGPTLSVMFEEKGHTVDIYDPFYAPDKSVLEKEYDFITTTETAEHLYEPLMELNRLWSCLKTGGFLGIMTKRHEGKEFFKDWHYKNDDTHVVFYHEETFEWLGKRWGAESEFLRSDVVIFRKV